MKRRITNIVNRHLIKDIGFDVKKDNTSIQFLQLLSAKLVQSKDYSNETPQSESVKNYLLNIMVGSSFYEVLDPLPLTAVIEANVRQVPLNSLSVYPTTLNSNNDNP